MRRISTVLAIAALASGCGTDKSKAPSPPADSPVAKPAEPAQGVKPAPAKSSTAAENEAAVTGADAAWWIDSGVVGPVRGGMTLDELRAVPGLTLKTITVEVPIELEGGGMDTEQQEQIQVWSRGEHQLTIQYAGFAKDDRQGTEDRIIGIDVYGTKPRLDPLVEDVEEQPSPPSVGTTAQELVEMYGKPSEWDADDRWTPGACALFDKARSAWFCFDSKAKRFEDVRKKNLAVKALVINL